MTSSPGALDVRTLQSARTGSTEGGAIHEADEDTAPTGERATRHAAGGVTGDAIGGRTGDPADDAVRDGLVDALPALWRFAFRLARHRGDAEDLVQRTCVRALEQAHRYDERGRLTSWLFRLCHNVWRNELRAASVRRERGFGHSAADASGAFRDRDAEGPEHAHSRTPERAAHLHQVLVAVETLPEAQRDVVLLVSVEGFGYRETAGILDVPIGTVMSRLARARLALGRRFERSATCRREEDA